MGSLISNYIVIVAISGVLSVLLALIAYYKKTDFAGTRAFILSSSASAVYTFGFALELSGKTLPQMFFWIKAEYLGMPFIAPASLLMVMHFVGLERLIKRKLLTFLFSIPALTTLMVWTNEYHHLFYASIRLQKDVPSPLVDVTMGPWYIVHGSFTFGCLLAAICLMVWQWNRMKRVYRRQMVTMIIGLSLPTLGSFLYLMGATPYGMDPVPVILSLTSALYIWAIMSRSMLTAAPIARENLFESMRDGVLVTDRFDLLVDYNRAAADMIPGLNSAAIGKPLSRVFRPAGEEAEAAVVNADPLRSEMTELEWKRNGGTFYFQLRSSPVLKRDGQRAGRMIMLIDVTERTLLQEKLRLLATTDSLTGIHNRPYFLEQSRLLLAQSAAEGVPLSIILLDVDHFKNINDHYGHACGDVALQHVAGICTRYLRSGDLFGRYGGEEFVLCLPGTGLAEAGRLADHIREGMEQYPLLIQDGPVSVTASFGVVEAEKGEKPLEELLSQADHALYTSKRSGRNSVHLHSGDRIIPFSVTRDAQVSGQSM